MTADGRPLDADDVQALRKAAGRLVALDSMTGADDLAPVAVRLFRSVHQRIGDGSYRMAVERDLHATAAELAEVAGWLLFDAERQDEARQLNHEAVFYARLSGDRSIERLVIQNMCLQAQHLRRPREALLLVRSVLDNDRLTAREAALFRSKEAGALALLGARGEALTAIAHARSLFLDGYSDDDPAWAWWVDERQFTGHESACHAALADWKPAIRLRLESLEHTPTSDTRDRFVSLALLLDTLTLAGAWPDAARVIEDVVPYLGTIGSGRTAGWVREAACRLEHGTSDRGPRTAAEHIRSRLDGEPIVGAGHPS